MKIERIDEKTVKCYLSNEDLEEYGLDYKDFMSRNGRAKELLDKIIAQAAEEVGYNPPSILCDMQIMILAGKGLVVTLSEQNPWETEEGFHSIMEDLEALKEIMGEDMPEDIQQTIEELKEDKLAGRFGTISEEDRKKTDTVEISGKEKGDSRGSITGNRGIGPAGKKEGKQVGKVGNTGKALKARIQQIVESHRFAVFEFERIREIELLAKSLPRTLLVKSTLYKMDGLYYLYLEKGRACAHNYIKALCSACEYGSLYTSAEDLTRHLEEFGECLIPEGALKKL